MLNCSEDYEQTVILAPPKRGNLGSFASWSMKATYAPWKSLALFIPIAKPPLPFVVGCVKCTAKSPNRKFQSPRRASPQISSTKLGDSAIPKKIVQNVL